MVVLLLLVLVSSVFMSEGAGVKENGTFELSVIHINDFHVRFESIHLASTTCKENEVHCLGGFSRLYSAIQKLKKEHPNALILNAGDNFYGTLWYTFYKWKAVAHFLNKIPFDAHTLGNHEFDDRIKGLVPLLKTLHAPTVVANIDDSKEPDIQGLYKKSIVIRNFGKKIGIIGVVVAETRELSNPEGLKFLDESESVNKEAIRLVEEENPDTIIVLSHCGYKIDKYIARNAAPKIGLIVGGHSHSLFYNGIAPNPLVVDGPYPTVVEHHDGRKVLIVQASAYSRFVGNITIQYDEYGNVTSWTGEPLYLSEHFLEDADINREIQEWKKGVDAYGSVELGRALVFLNNQECRNYECSLGNFIADSMIYGSFKKGQHCDGSYATAALINSGAFKKPIVPGPITIVSLLESLPHLDTIDIGELQGKYLKEALEHAALEVDGQRNLLQVSGLKVVYNATNAPGSKAVSVKIWCRDCKVPTYKELDTEKYYRIAVRNFLVHGGDGFLAISNNLVNHTICEDHFLVLQRYIETKSPLQLPATDGRIQILT